MSATDDEANIDPYALLGLTPASTEKDIKTAYRKKSLTCHPDRNPDNPQAAHQFHLLSVAQAILLDAPQRAKFDAKAEEKVRQEKRMEGFASKKREGVQDLLAREEAYKRARKDAVQQNNLKAAETAVQSEGRQLREAAQAAKLAAEEFARMEAKRAEKQSLNSRARAREEGKTKGEVKPVGEMDRTLRLSLPLPEFASLTTSSAALEAHLALTYGKILHSLLRTPAPSAKASKKGKAKEVVSAVLEFAPENLSGCWALYEDCRLGRGLNSKGGVKAKWAGGAEPEWVARLGSQFNSQPTPPPTTTSASGPAANTPPPISRSAPPTSSAAAPSFSFDPLAAPAPSFNGPSSTADYENATLLRMRQAERERLEREIRESEMDDDA